MSLDTEWYKSRSGASVSLELVLFNYSCFCLDTLYIIIHLIKTFIINIQ